MDAAKNLPRELTSYDVLKFFAVAIMVIDHLGYYFYPEIEMLRAVGRIGFPIWFFLIGFASGREIGWMLPVGAVILTATSFMAGLHIFPLTALVTIMLVRLVLDIVMRMMTRNAALFALVFAVLLALALESGRFVEYGTQGLIFAVFGYMARHRPAIPGMGGGAEAALYTMLAAAGAFVMVQQYVFRFEMPEFLIMASGTLLVCAALYMFKPMVLPGMTARVPGAVRGVIQFCGRHTLAIYVGHLVLFRVAALLWVGSPFTFMTLRLFAP